MDDNEFMGFFNEFMDRKIIGIFLETYEQQTGDDIAPKVIRGLMDNGCPPSAIIKTFKELTRGINNDL